MILPNAEVSIPVGSDTIMVIHVQKGGEIKFFSHEGGELKPQPKEKFSDALLREIARTEGDRLPFKKFTSLGIMITNPCSWVVNDGQLYYSCRP